ncbi:hypothetical protein V1512DRAFT_259987 [Lipomyces arxii]|uniref:uncharacterized protein n=1 Tax=Lipomyces arxii TaxID=56418 RepID=UPI0034CF7434
MNAVRVVFCYRECFPITMNAIRSTMAPSSTSSAANTPPAAALLPFSLYEADITTAPKPFRNPRAKPPSKRIKNAKQVATDEAKRLAVLPNKAVDLPTYINVEAPPSVLPRKFWCDVTGLSAPYKMPGTGLRYHSKDVYEAIKQLPPGVDQQYLQLRSANVILK